MWQTLGTVYLCYNKLEDKKKLASRRVFTGILTKCKQKQKTSLVCITKNCKLCTLLLINSTTDTQNMIDQ